jgi:hypothetical protein
MIDQVHAITTAALGRALCAHSKTRVVVLPPGQHHYARVVCSDGGKQLYWKPKPENEARRKINAANLQKLLDNDRLADWERDFCQGLSKLNLRLSPRQQALLNGLVEQYLRGEDIQNAETKRNGALVAEYAA